MPMTVLPSAVRWNKRLVANAEFLMPIPGIGLDKSFRFGGFIDTGYVWATSQKMRLSDLRYSIGVSLSWASPFGPLKVSAALPLNKKSGDQIEHFQFQMGTHPALTSSPIMYPIVNAAQAVITPVL